MRNVTATTETHEARTTANGNGEAASSLEGAALILHDRRRFAGEPPESPSGGADAAEGQHISELIERVTGLEAALGATLSLLRRCIVEHTTPTRDDLASEAAFVFGTSREAAMADLDEMAQMVGVSSVR
jgi:hypothetical protein